MQKAHFSLSQLTEIIRQTINDTFGFDSYWVVGEISNHKEYDKRHYFELVEKNEQRIVAKIGAIAWDNVNSQILSFEHITGQRFTSGIKVLLNVRVNYSPQYGLSLYVQDIDSSYTLGDLARQKQETLERLVHENDFITFEDGEYYTLNKTLLLPPVIQKIAVVSSIHSAGIEDFERVLAENNFGYHFSLQMFHSSVQGENKDSEIVDALKNVFYANEKESFDAVVILRGGGSESDFRIFDSYNVGRIVAKFPIPIFTGIGHSKDETIADLMAHTSTKTPTDTARFFVEYNCAFESSCIELRERIAHNIKELLFLHEKHLNELAHGLMRNTKDMLFHYGSGVEKIRLGITSGIKQIFGHRKELLNLGLARIAKHPVIFIKNRGTDLQHFVSLIHLAEPQNLLKRGFALLRHNGRIVRNAQGVKTGDTVEIILSKEKLTSTIDKYEEIRNSRSWQQSE